MVELTLPKNSKVGKGRHYPAPGRRQDGQDLPGLPLRPRGDREPALGHLRRRRRRLRADGAGRADPHQEHHGPDAGLPPLLPRGRLRLLRHEHRRAQHAGLHPRLGGGPGQGRADQPAAAPAGGQGPDPRPDACSTPSTPRSSPGCTPTTPEPQKEWRQSPGGPREAGRPLRVHPLRLLLDLVPQLLVERREVPGPGDPAARLPLADRQPRRGHRRAARRAGGPLQALSLPHHHELRPGLPQGPEPRQGDRRGQEDAGRAGASERGSCSTPRSDPLACGQVDAAVIFLHRGVHERSGRSMW